TGNAGRSTNLVVVVDSTNPVLIPPEDLAVNSDPGQCFATRPALGNPTATDNCGVALVTNNAPSFLPVGTNFVTWTAIDIHGNSTESTQRVIVADIEPPMITCPTNITVSADVGQNYASSVALGTPLVSDNCGVFSTTNDAPSHFPLGTNSVVWTAVDIHGNLNTCVQNVIVHPAPSQPHGISSIVNNGDGSFTLNFTGAAYIQYVVQAS